MDWATWWAVAWVGRRACCSFLPVGTWYTQQQVGMGGGGWKLSGEGGSCLQTHSTTGHFHGVLGLLSPADTRRKGAHTYSADEKAISKFWRLFCGLSCP